MNRVEKKKKKEKKVTSFKNILIFAASNVMKTKPNKGGNDSLSARYYQTTEY
jgi:hypothetical protein